LVLDQTLTFSITFEIFASTEVKKTFLHKLKRHALPPIITLIYIKKRVKNISKDI